MTSITTSSSPDLIALSGNIVSAFVSQNPLNASEVPRLIGEVHRALSSLRAQVPSEAVLELKPAVPIKRSVTADFIICLEDGQKFKSMKRHIAQLGMTPDEYRAKWKLPHDYPMVAANYSAKRSALAKSYGLGRKPEPPKKSRSKAKRSA